MKRGTIPFVISLLWLGIVIGVIGVVVMILP
jgi:hypothetical protein